MISEIKKQNLADDVYNCIKTNIRSGILPEGSKIPSENQLSKSMNVSRVVIREALFRLRSEHMIVTYKGKGSFVANPKNFTRNNDLDYVINKIKFEEIMEFRSCIEFAAIKKATSSATESDLQKIYEHYLKMKDSISDPYLFTLNDYNFHYSVIEASHNSVFCEIMNLKSKEIIESLEIMNRLNDSREWALTLHKKIMEKLFLRDSKGAIELLKNNGEYNIARIEEILKNI